MRNHHHHSWPTGCSAILRRERSALAACDVFVNGCACDGGVRLRRQRRGGEGEYWRHVWSAPAVFFGGLGQRVYRC